MPATEPLTHPKPTAVAAGPPQSFEVTTDVVGLRTAIANVYFVGPSGAPDRGWVLVDAGMYGSSSAIAEFAARRFGRESRPSAIVLTHGHFDHVGGLPDLAERWQAPVIAHRLELPYLTGRSAYPPPDPTVGGGMMSRLSFLYPRGPIDLSGRVLALPDDGTVPGLDGWRWVATPGHSPGHVSFFREADRTLIVGDAFVTTRQESLFSVMAQAPEMNGPPRYFTCDWGTAHRSVADLAELAPEVVATGHGLPLRGPSMRSNLEALARDFAWRAVPRQGRYVDHPAIADADGVVVLPGGEPSPWPMLAAGLGAGVVVGLGLTLAAGGRRQG